MLTEGDFRWYFSHTYESPLSGTTITEVTPLLRKSLFSNRNHSSLTEVTFNYESHVQIRKSLISQFKLWKLTSGIDGLRKSTSSCVIFTLFKVVYESPLLEFIVVYGNPLPASCDLRKSTSKIKSLAKVDFRFMVYVLGIVTHKSILQSSKWCLYLSIDAWKTWQQQRKMKNYEGTSTLHVLM